MNRIFSFFVFLLLMILSTASLFAGPISDLDTSSMEGIGTDKKVVGSGNPFSRESSMANDLTIEELRLVGIASNENESYALVSGQIIKRGDKIAGYRVEEVGNDYVMLKRLDETYVLNFAGGM